MRGVSAIVMLLIATACGSSPQGPAASGPGAGSGSATPAASRTPAASPTGNATTTTPAPTQAAAGSRIEGVVSVSPACGNATPPCQAPSYTLRDALVQAKSPATGATVASTRTDAGGDYRIGIEPGRYRIVVSGGRPPTGTGDPPKSCPSPTVVVRAGAAARADVECLY